MNVKLNLDNRLVYNKKFFEFCTKIVSSYYGLPFNIWNMRTRKRPYIIAKQIIVYMMQRHCQTTLFEMQDLCKYGNHASVIHARNKIKDYLTWDKVLKEEINEIEKLLLLESGIQSKINLEKDYYFINMNNVKTIKKNMDKAIVFIGYTEKEINQVKELLEFNTTIPIVDHKNTGHYLFMKNQKKTNEE